MAKPFVEKSHASLASQKQHTVINGLSGARRYIFRLTFGIVGLVAGLAIIAWVCYNEFVERLPQYTGFHWWEPFGIGPALVATGWYWLKSLARKRVTDEAKA
jgi:hypothetical protein